MLEQMQKKKKNVNIKYNVRNITNKEDTVELLINNILSTER